MAAALAKLIEEFQHNTQIQLYPDINLASPLSSETNTALFRVVQEALTNISKHSHATQVHLSLTETSQTVTLVLEDNGSGFDPSENTTGFGLQGMRERIEALGGRLWLCSQPGRGCQIQAEIPLRIQNG